MIKEENLCIHCGLCAESCPTSAWDMQKSTLDIPYAIDEMNDGKSNCQQKRKVG